MEWQNTCILNGDNMKKTDIFFLIHNYNTVPTNLTEYCEDFLIMDSSDDEEVKRKLDETYPADKIMHIENTGHNLTSYFDYFIRNYDKLPEYIALLKGNIIGRHVSQEFFDRAYDNHFFTFLYEEKNMRAKYEKGSEECPAFLLDETHFAESNSSWYMRQSHSYRYFYDLDDFIRFVYEDAVIPKYATFAPGGCYIISKHQVLKNSVTFYKNLNTLMEYRKEYNFPAEAYLVERIMPYIFGSNYKTRSWMEDEAEFAGMLEKCEESTKAHDAWNSQHLKRVKMWLGAKPPVFLEGIL